MQKEVIEIIADSLGVKKEEIALENKLIDDLGADSLDLVELILLLEEEFEIEIPDRIAENVIIVKDIVDYIERVKRQ